MYDITQEELWSLINYDEKTGEFIRHNGRVAGNLRIDGFMELALNYRTYRADRLAYFYVHGCWPWKIGHIDGNKMNNAIANLYAIEKPEPKPKKPRKERIYNNKTGFRGVSEITVEEGITKYSARRSIQGQMHFLGYYETPHEAHSAYCDAERIISKKWR